MRRKGRGGKVPKAPQAAKMKPSPVSLREPVARSAGGDAENTFTVPVTRKQGAAHGSGPTARAPHLPANQGREDQGHDDDVEGAGGEGEGHGGVRRRKFARRCKARASSEIGLLDQSGRRTTVLLAGIFGSEVGGAGRVQHRRAARRPLRCPVWPIMLGGEGGGAGSAAGGSAGLAGPAGLDDLGRIDRHQGAAGRPRRAARRSRRSACAAVAALRPARQGGRRRSFGLGGAGQPVDLGAHLVHLAAHLVQRIGGRRRRGAAARARALGLAVGAP